MKLKGQDWKLLSGWVEKRTNCDDRLISSVGAESL
jgi:hypothetical protein